MLCILRSVVVTHQRPFVLVAAACLLAFALAGCGGVGTAATTQIGDELAVGHVPSLGRVLTDSDGHTLYLYLPDAHEHPTCYGICARQWPPLLAARGSRLGPGVDRAMVGEIRRRDGEDQVTYDGWPLYRWRQDTTPGQASGEGLSMGLWLAMSPSGHEVR